MQQKLQREAASVEKLDEIWTKKSWRCLKYGNRGRSNRQILYFQCIVKYKSLNPVAHPIYFIYLLTLLLIHLHFMLFIYSFPPSPAAGLVSVHRGSSSMATWCVQHVGPQCSLVFSMPCLSLPLALHSALFLCSRVPSVLLLWSCCPSIFLLSLKRSELAKIIFQPLWGLPAGAPTLEQKERGWAFSLLYLLPLTPSHFIFLLSHCEWFPLLTLLPSPIHAAACLGPPILPPSLFLFNVFPLFLFPQSLLICFSMNLLT